MLILNGTLCYMLTIPTNPIQIGEFFKLKLYCVIWSMVQSDKGHHRSSIFIVRWDKIISYWTVIGVYKSWTYKHKIFHSSWFVSGSTHILYFRFNKSAFVFAEDAQWHRIQSFLCTFFQNVWKTSHMLN